MLDVVLDAFAAGRDHDRVTRRVLGVEQPDLAGELAAERDHDRLLVAGQVDADPEPLVRLFHHQHVIGRAEGVPPDLVRAPGVVDLGVEDRRTVGGPGRAVVHLGQLVRQQLAGVEVLDPQREPLVALEVDGVRQQAPVGGYVDGAEREELGVAGHLVAVEHDLFARDLAVGGRWLVAVHLDPAVQRVLLALDRARVVPVPAAPGRNAQVGLQRPVRDLLEDCLTQRFQVRRPRLGVRVLGPQVPQHLVIALVPQPLVLVDEHITVMHPLNRLPRSNRRRHRRRNLRHAARLPASPRTARPPPPAATPRCGRVRRNRAGHPVLRSARGPRRPPGQLR